MNHQKASPAMMMMMIARMMNIGITIATGDVEVGVGGAGELWVGDGSRFWHTVLEKGVHFFTSSSPALHFAHRLQTSQAWSGTQKVPGRHWHLVSVVVVQGAVSISSERQWVHGKQRFIPFECSV